MRTIFKYKLEFATRQQIEMPVGARVLSVAEQNGGLFVWAIVDTSKPNGAIGFTIVGTGREIREPYHTTFVGTVLMSDGCVWHVFTN